jgi:hypothetical protein
MSTFFCAAFSCIGRGLFNGLDPTKMSTGFIVSAIMIRLTSRTRFDVWIMDQKDSTMFHGP